MIDDPQLQRDRHSCWPAFDIDLVDVHQHIGRSMATGNDNNEADVLAAMNRYGVTTGLVMPQPGGDALRLHDRIMAMGEAYPGRVFGIVNMDPRCPEHAYVREVERCVRAGFVALKIHTLGYAIAPNSPDCEKIFELASVHQIPVMVHTGLGVPMALPSLVLSAALRFSQVPIVLCHAGFGTYCDEAVAVAQAVPNIYLEPSWCPTFAVRMMLDRLGPSRILFGSDHLDNLPVELAKFDALALPDATRAALFSDNARNLFRLSVFPNQLGRC